MTEEKYVELLEDGELYDYIIDLQKENERLNNIINGMEKFLSKVIEQGSQIEQIICGNILYHLQQLKENK